MSKTDKRAALYVRVSMPYKQHPQNQTRQLAQWCRENGYRIVQTFTDRECGAEPDRPQFRRLFEAAARREFDLILCWSLDRFSREGIAETFIHLKRLQESGVKFYSLTEEYFRTTGPAADFLIAVTAWVADHERRRRQERIKAGLARAREQGKIIGRRAKQFTRKAWSEMKAMYAAGVPLRTIAHKFKTSKSTVGRRLKPPAERRRTA